MAVEVQDERTLRQGEPFKELEEVMIESHRSICKDRVTTLCKGQEGLIHFLQRNLDVFAWLHEDMLGVDQTVMTHRLSVDPNAKPIKQKKRNFAPKRNKAIAEEVENSCKPALFERYIILTG